MLLTTSCHSSATTDSLQHDTQQGKGLTLIGIVFYFQLHLPRVRLQRHQATLEVLLLTILGVFQGDVPLQGERERRGAGWLQEERQIFIQFKVWKHNSTMLARFDSSNASVTVTAHFQMAGTIVASCHQFKCSHSYPLRPGRDRMLQSYTATEPRPVLWPALHPRKDSPTAAPSSRFSARCSSVVSFFSQYGSILLQLWVTFHWDALTRDHRHLNLRFPISRHTCKLPVFL